MPSARRAADDQSENGEEFNLGASNALFCVVGPVAQFTPLTMAESQRNCATCAAAAAVDWAQAKAKAKALAHIHSAVVGVNARVYD